MVQVLLCFCTTVALEKLATQLPTLFTQGLPYALQHPLTADLPCSSLCDLRQSNIGGDVSKDCRSYPAGRTITGQREGTHRAAGVLRPAAEYPGMLSMGSVKFSMTVN